MGNSTFSEKSTADKSGERPGNRLFVWVRASFDWLTDKLTMVGAVTLVGMMLMTCLDVIGRFFGSPIQGAIEIVGFLAILTVALALPYTHRVDGHIGVELFIRMLSPRTQAIVNLFTGILSMALFALVTWQMYEYGVIMKQSGEVSMSLKFPQHLVIYIVSVCFLVFSLAIIRNISGSIKKIKGEK